MAALTPAGHVVLHDRDLARVSSSSTSGLDRSWRMARRSLGNPPPLPPGSRVRIAANFGAMQKSYRRQVLKFGGGAAAFWLAVAGLVSLQPNTTTAPLPSADPAPMTIGAITKPKPKQAEAAQPTANAGIPETWSADVTPTPSPPAPKLSPTEKGAGISVPTDAKASYTVESVAKPKGGLVRIVSRRIGPSGTSYSHRECNCAKSTFRYLGDPTSR
ncbi:MAG: hypothetical protein ABL907_10670 [Hyphomicrobium sp.]